MFISILSVYMHRSTDSNLILTQLDILLASSNNLLYVQVLHGIQLQLINTQWCSNKRYEFIL